jgi:hypothetical protein
MMALPMTGIRPMLRHLLLALAVFGMAVPVSDAWAQGSQCVKSSPRKAKGSMTEGTFRRLEKVNKLIVDNKNDEALADLREMSEKSSYSGYEKALILQTMAFVYGGMNKYGKAIEIFEQVLNMDVLPQPAWESMLYNTGQLYLADGKIDKAIKTLEEYMCQAQGTISSDARVALGSAYAERKRWRDALNQVEKALEGVKAPKESWLQFKLALHFELKEYPQCAETLLQLIGIAPAKEDYWKQLSSIFFELKNDQQSMAALAVADAQGFIDEDREIRNLANIYLLMDIPYKAAVLLQSGLDKNVLKPEEKLLTMLADAWYLAREYKRSEAALKRLAELTGKGDVYFRLAQLSVEDEQWKKALDYVAQARAKGATKIGNLALMAGIAQFNLDNVAEARKELSTAGADDDVRGQAVAWMNYIDQVESSKAQAIAAQKAIEEARKEREERAAKFEKMM